MKPSNNPATHLAAALSAFKVIRAWASYDVKNFPNIHPADRALYARHVLELCDEVLKKEEV